MLEYKNDMKTKGDLHSNKKSHLTVPISKGIEMHMEKKDLKGLKVKTGQKVHAHIPMVVTSVDKGHSRFKQRNKVEIHNETPNNKLKRVVKSMFGAKEK